MKEIVILQLYARDMNIYGDEGNVLVLKRRLEWHGYTPILIRYNPGDTLPENVDIVIGGGGQDSGQDKIQADLLAIGNTLRTWADSNVPMLVVCGLYQLFGHSFKTADGHTIKGIGLLDVTTIGKPERLIGNVVAESSEFGEVVGYENHSGQTFLGSLAQPFATVRLGAGNNADDTTEGARFKNVIGTYLHGSILPKNPTVADFLIQQAALNKFGEFTPNIVDDSFAQKARRVASNRPR